MKGWAVCATLSVAEDVGPACVGSVGTGASVQSSDANSAQEDLELAGALPQLGQDPKYEPFLYAPVGDDRRGATVTVLSMLARLGVDPWGEAAGLASLPEGAEKVGDLYYKETDELVSFRIYHY